MSGQPQQQLTDHYIQLEILAKLAQSTVPVRFTDLKDPGIENSLFMYHANKLLNKGLVTKNDGVGFALTAKGASWINFVGFKNIQPQITPRLLVQFIITNQHDEVLLSRRTGSMGQLLNQYMLPGGLYKYGKSADENARIQLGSFITETKDATMELATVAEMIQVNQASDTYHSIGYIYQTSFNGEPVSDDPQYELVWFKRSQLTQSNDRLTNSGFIPALFARLQGGLKSHELFDLS